MICASWGVGGRVRVGSADVVVVETSGDGSDSSFIFSLGMVYKGDP